MNLRIVDSGFAKHAEAEQRLSDQAVAQRRMAHLKTGVLPPAAISSKATAQPQSPEERERMSPLAWRVIAVQVWHTTNTSALK